MKKLNLIGLIALVALSFTSCKKEGCTDGNATNFNGEAKKDDASCTYEGSVVFHYNEETAGTLIDNDAEALTYYVDGNIVGSGAANVYFDGVPDCGAGGVVTVTKNLGLTKGKSYSYKIVDEDGWVWWEGIINFEANTCLKFKLTV